MAASGLGSLGFWLDQRRRPGGRLHNLKLPPGNGPLVILRSTPAAGLAASQVSQALKAARPDLRLIVLGQDGMPDIAEDPIAAPQLLSEAAPAAIILLGDALPVSLICAAEDAGIPLILGQASLHEETGWGLRRGMQRQLLAAFWRICVTDGASRVAALRMGVPADRVVVTGPVTETRDPLPGFEAERAILAAMMRGRHVWLAAALPEAEEQAVLQAHLAALRYSHRALLVIMPADPSTAKDIAARFEAAGLTVARRDAEEEPTDEVQVQIADDLHELGLWYRLAPLCFMGGTLSGDHTAARHPFEAAALGSAIIHGPRLGDYETVWRQLDAAGATRAIKDEDELALAVTELAQPQLVAALASNAWAVSTGGAGVALDLARPVLDLLGEHAA